MEIKLVAAVSLDGAIGHNDDLLWDIPEDLKRYKKITTGNVVIMGRKTYMKLPIRALENRSHIIIHDKNTELPVPCGLDVIGSNSVEEALEHAKKIAIDGNKNIIIAGGAMIYESMIDLCDNIELTWVYKDYLEANKMFPMAKLLNDFDLVGDEPLASAASGVSYKYSYYVRTNK